VKCLKKFYWPFKFQQTIKRTIKIEGKGIHTGINCRMQISPLPEDSGIVFRRTDLNEEIQSSVFAVNNLKRSTGIGNDKISVRTVEHLLAAFHITGISNVLVEIDKEEIPFLDGACFAFVKLIRSAGIVKQKKEINPLFLNRPLTVSDKNDFICYVPSEKTMIVCGVNFPHPLLKNKIFVLDLEKDDPVMQISKARTFGFENEIETLKDAGLALGGTLDNAVIFTEKGILNKKLNYPDEAVRHKILDFLGDMYLCFRPLKGFFLVYRNSHSLDVSFLKIMLEIEKEEREVII